MYELDFISRFFEFLYFIILYYFWWSICKDCFTGTVSDLSVFFFG